MSEKKDQFHFADEKKTLTKHHIIPNTFEDPHIIYTPFIRESTVNFSGNILPSFLHIISQFPQECCVNPGALNTPWTSPGSDSEDIYQLPTTIK